MMLGPYKLGPHDTENWGIYTGDARELSEAIPDESVDLIFADPPYPKEYLFCYEILADIAAKKLLVGGSLMTLVASPNFDTIFDILRSRLNYYWLNCFYQPTVTNTGRYWPKQIYIRWKPVIWFVKGKREPNGFIQDGVSGAFNDKRFHKWGQHEQWAFYWIEQLTKKIISAVVLDPFTGGGTVPSVCRMLNRRWLAFEIDSDTADAARRRVAQTQPPLNLPMPEQAEMELCVVEY
jgi:DNA modification methylase